MQRSQGAGGERLDRYIREIIITRLSLPLSLSLFPGMTVIISGGRRFIEKNVNDNATIFQ